MTTSNLQHEHYMHMALELAERARGRTSPNPLVGAVIVKDGDIAGLGYHQKAGTPHAEVHALRAAGDKARGAALYVTLEPCSHYGRTPPCSEAIIAAGIKEVYVAMQDPNPLVAGRGIKQMQDAGLTVHLGLLEKDARRLNEIFIKYITTKRPFILFKSAMTADGKIATGLGHSRWVTGEAAREKVHRLRDWYDAILVGVNTVLADNPALTCRLPIGEGRDPIRIILDSAARTPPEAQILNQASDAPTYIVVTDKAPLDRIKTLTSGKAKIIRISQDLHGRVDLRKLLVKLGEMEVTSILLEGGAEIAASFLDNGLIDKTITFIAPKIIGGHKAPGPVGGKGRAMMNQAIKLNDTCWGQVGEDFFIEGYPDYSVCWK
ncbi:MAG: bifunctional diaminohydroxyphosphoribosylaminopyrimidine deaminase/5-amino-6-(5-phosphoribosylamino)uracil reductase RibD [Thermincola sp.]|jgi:diaminohydroxyphosphoribosylaminopyrimidine deaminase/5-amino-6-(5-phosphoribosylamino)uracil reductase|nr:bifunctional diaminohydroxyphosphoribosylaminopyrimidine deaminase/5-amino-6-(5-phosphoribosylamino)uracil reductase RibD [Thermincola sp.]